jgi:uncharacterized protein YabE (DUF348 family)
MSKQHTSNSTKQQRHIVIHNWHKHPFFIPVATFLLLFFMSLVLFVVSGAQTLGATDSRVVLLSIDGERQSLPTRARTVGNLLERLEINLAKKDVIEPSIDTPIHDNDFRINIYRARTVLIVDGENQVIIETAEPTPRGVVETAGIDVFPEDIVEKESNELVQAVDILQAGVISDRVVVERALPIKLNLFGVDYDVRTHAETVSELLADRGVALEDASVFPASGEALEANQAVFVTDPDKEITMEDVSIPQDQESVDDFDLVIGNTVVRSEGRPGRKVVVYEIDENGDRSVLQAVIVRQPVNRIIAEGRKLPTIVNASDNVRLGEQLAATRGWAGEQWSCLYQLWQKESGWSHASQNRSSGAYGIPQALPGSKMSSVGADWQTNPATQITWGMGYISGRYGTPCQALSHSAFNGWY